VASSLPVEPARWVTAGGIALAITTPPLTYRYAKAAMLRLLFKLDPSEENTHDR